MKALRPPDHENTVTRLLNLIKSVDATIPLKPEPAPPFPDKKILARLMATAFWASLQKEEGRPITFSLMFIPPSTAGDSFVLDQPLPLDTISIVKLAPALAPQRRLLGITTSDENGLSIWGTASPSFFGLIVEVMSPGALTIRYFGRPLMVFSAGNAVFLEDENRFGLLSLIQGAFKDESPFPNPFTLSAVLLGLIRSLLRQGHGGTILVFPATASRWDKHLTSIRYRSSAPFRSLRDAIDRLQVSNQLPMTMPEAMLSFQLQEGLRDSIEQVGLLTAVDGALLINSDLEVLGFGAMINSSKLNAEDKLFVFEPGKPKDVRRTATVKSLGGARHRAAADFCVLQEDALAFVASQDGRLTVLGWFSSDKQLWALERAETYLL